MPATRTETNHRRQPRCEHDPRRALLRQAGARCLTPVWALACAVAGLLVCAPVASAAGSAAYFTRLTGSGQSLVEAREGAVAATLPDGEVMIAGGWRGGPVSTTAELFNPATDTFTELTGSGQSLNRPRLRATASALPDGQVLIAGGVESNPGNALSSAELFDPATDTFTELAGQMSQAREDAVATPLPGGQVLIAGGYSKSSSSYLSSAELFNPATDTFTLLTGSDQSLSQPTFASVAADLPDGQVLIAGGSFALSSAELFSPESNTFSELAQSTSEPREGAAAATLPDGQVLIVGGWYYSFLTSAELFSPATDSFSKLTGSGESLSEPRYGAATATLPDGEVLIVGGLDDGTYLSTAELFVSAPQAEISGGEFGEQTVGEQAAEQVLSVQNLGVQPLSISGLSLAGADDFTVDRDACEGVQLAFHQQCTISVSYTPGSEGAASATLTLTDNESNPAVVTLTGTGVPAEHGPQGPQGLTGATGETGSTGLTGAMGPAGAAGPTGPAGDAGPAGAAGKVELVTCTTVARKTAKKGKGKPTQRCTTKLISGTVKFTATGKASTATLTRAGVKYATGSADVQPHSTHLLLSVRHGLPSGLYTLKLAGRRDLTRETVLVR